MTDNLPLIPEKCSVCADVRPILRTVFCELNYLPPLTTELPVLTGLGPGDQTLTAEQWTEKYKSECKEIWNREGELKQQHAKRMSREPLPNIYRLHAPGAMPAQPQWRLERGLISRRDLVPTIQQNAGRDGTLWIKNILNRSSCDVSAVELAGRSHSPRQPSLLPHDDAVTMQTLSMGTLEAHPPLPPPPPPPPLPQPHYIVCVPPQLDFINFTVGQLHTQGLRLVNVSKFEIRLSVRPPKRRELDVEIYGPRGLTVTSGAAAEFRVHFRPSDVRTVRDTLLIRVSMGRHFRVPIACYMQPPILDILIPSMTSSALTCTPDDQGACLPMHGGDILELGTRLLGDVHCARVLLHCDADHASFFTLTEDAWFSFNLDCLTIRGSVIAGPFVLWPAWWGGGGAVRGCAWCRADHAGLHAVALRVLSSTAVVRHLHVLADSLLFRPDHLTIVAQDKDYDICGEGEPACEYYVNLGTAFPNRSLSATVQLVNHSPVVYSYYWSVRPWGVCSCWEDEKEAEGSLGPEDDSERLCIGAREARSNALQSPSTYESKSETARLVRVEPTRAQIMARSSCALHVHVPDVGARLGMQRAVLMLVLKNIPRESFPPDYEPMIIAVEEVQSENIPGVESGTREVCEVVCAQMEVWWDVAPVRFALDPPQLRLYHSRRLESVVVEMNATQLFGCEGARVTWQVGARVPAPAPLRLAPATTCRTLLTLPLPSLPNHYPETEVITMVAANEEWRSQCTITRQCATRHPALRPARAWLGVVPPAAHMHTTFQLCNDTHQHICWWAEAYRWWGENEPSPACVGRPPCSRCQERACSCSLLRPARGALAHGDLADITYHVNAPDCDGCVATLVQARRTSADVARVPGGAGSEARAALVAYRVLAPRLVLRALPCYADNASDSTCGGCKLDVGAGGAVGRGRGTATLRPLEALTLGRRTCYRLQITNVTPLPTAVHFDRIYDAMDVLKVKFTPNDFSVRPYGEVEVRVVLEARRVSGRRLFVYRAHVERAYRPLYLLVDTAIAGLKISCEVPLGGGVNPDSFIIMRRTQKEEFPWEEGKPKPSTADEMFAAEDRKRDMVGVEKKCRCPFEMTYIPPVKPPRPPRPPGPPHSSGEQSPIQIVTSPPELTRVCACARCSKPDVPELDAPICLQYTAVPLRTVRTRTLHLRNESVVTARWSTAVRCWPRTRTHATVLAADQWASDVGPPGVAVQCEPARGVLAAHADVYVHVRVYADCWGLYYDQLLVQVENVEPIVLDMWMEAVGPPLQMALKPSDKWLDPTPSMWMSASEPARVVRARNVSRSELTVTAYVARNHQYPQDALPLRLYLRLYDVPPRTCPCLTAFHSEHLLDEQSDVCSLEEEMDTGFELYLALDCGPQDNTHYMVSPEVRSVGVGESVDWQVTLLPPPHDGEPAPDVTLLLRLQPRHYSGPRWHRPEPPPQLVRLLPTMRTGCLKLSCRELRVRLCALDLPYGDVLRVRKRFYAMNVGNGPLELGVETEAPWCVVEEHVGAAAAAAEAAGGRREGGALCGAGCWCLQRVSMRHHSMPLRLEPRSCVEMCVEVAVSTAEAWPAVVGATGAGGGACASAAALTAGACQTPAYPERRVTCTSLHLFDDNIIKTVPLILDLEYPILRVVPPLIDFGFVTDGETRKSYFSISHTSRTMTLDIVTQWIGGKEFQIWPPYLRIPPRASAVVYVQYTAIWKSAPAEGCARVSVCCGAGAGGGGGGGGGGVGGGGAGAQEQASAAWCRAAVAVRAAPSRDHKFHITRHDHTDDAHLLPPKLFEPSNTIKASLPLASLAPTTALKPK